MFLYSVRWNIYYYLYQYDLLYNVQSREMFISPVNTIIQIL